jgi:acyl-CoA thioesterase I
VTSPSLGTSSPASSPSKVDLPEPETPMIATLSPALISKLTPDKMSSGPSAVMTRLPRLTAETIAPLLRLLIVRGLAAILLFAVLAGAAHARTIVVLGDSLSAAYGIELRRGWVALLQQRLDQEKLPYKVINASVSGDTTAGGLARLPKLLAQHKPDIVIVELGGNDGLRGQSPEQAKKNLEAIASRATAAGAKVLLLGIRLPPNYGTQYNERFQRIYTDVAAARKLPLVPVLFEGLTADATNIQSDGIHPTAAAQPRILENVWSGLRALL